MEEALPYLNIYQDETPAEEALTPEQTNFFTGLDGVDVPATTRPEGDDPGEEDPAGDDPGEEDSAEDDPEGEDSAGDDPEGDDPEGDGPQET